MKDKISKQAWFSWDLFLSPHWMAALLGLISLHITFHHLLQSSFVIDLPRYAAGEEEVVFQNRVLMHWYLKWAQDFPLWSVISPRMVGSLKDPLILSLVPIAWGSMTLGFLAIWASLRTLSQDPRLVAFGMALSLWFAYFIYGLSIIQDFVYPYDHPAFLAMSVGTWLIVSRREGWLFLLIPLAALNRETVVFLIPLLLAYRYGQTPIAQEVFSAVCLGALWLAGKSIAATAVSGTAAPIKTSAAWNGMQVQLGFNLHIPVSPFHLLNLLMAGGLMFPLWLACSGSVVHPGLRRAQWVAVAYIVLMSVFAILSEVRIFGELIPLGTLSIVSALSGLPVMTQQAANQPRLTLPMGP